jgi:hypothetical protein
MSWLGPGPVLSIVVGYLLFLFGVAYWAERSRRLRHPRIQMLTYVLTASVYCTAWTFYGSVGLAANQGLEFLTIYLGPALVALLWPVLLRRLVRVAKEQRITSISDFISSRYGKSAPLGALVAGLVVIGLIPYIALQLQAVSQSFKLILDRETIFELFDPTLLVALVLGVFGILFRARTRRNAGASPSHALAAQQCPLPQRLIVAPRRIQVESLCRRGHNGARRWHPAPSSVPAPSRDRNGRRLPAPV